LSQIEKPSLRGGFEPTQRLAPAMTASGRHLVGPLPMAYRAAVVSVVGSGPGHPRLKSPPCGGASNPPMADLEPPASCCAVRRSRSRQRPALSARSHCHGPEPVSRCDPPWQASNPPHPAVPSAGPAPDSAPRCLRGPTVMGSSPVVPD